MGTKNVAVPPSNSMIDRSRSNSSLVSTRLRAASEMQRQGMISGQEKELLKNLILQSDSTFKEKFDEARKSGDISGIKRLLLNNPLISQSSIPENSMVDMTLNDVNDFGQYLDDSSNSNFNSQQSSYSQSSNYNKYMPPPNTVQQHRGSLGFGSEMMRMKVAQNSNFQQQSMGDPYARKRQGSKSLPVQGQTKMQFQQQNRPIHGNMRMDDYVQQTPAGPMSPMGLQMYQQMNLNTVPQVRAPPNPSSIKQEGYPLNIAGLSKAGGGYVNLQNDPSNSIGYNLRLPGGEIESGEDRLIIAKSRKNERERKRRLAVTRGFDELFKLLKELEEEKQRREENPKIGILGNTKLDKASILKNAIEKIQGFELQIIKLREKNKSLKEQIDAKK